MFARRRATAFFPALWLVAFAAVSLHAQAGSGQHSAPTNLQEVSKGDSVSILVLGDSISAGYGMNIEDGWVSLMNQTLIQRESNWRLINASVSGETTTGGLYRLPELLQEHSPQIVVLELGGNDGLRGYPTNKILNNLLAMTELVLNAGAKPVIITMRIPPNYGPRYTRGFEAVFAEAAKQSGAALVPFLFEALAVSEDLMQDDGIHPTAKAQPILVEGFLPYLEPLM